jgi:hypothetical protein
MEIDSAIRVFCHFLNASWPLVIPLFNGQPQNLN